MGVVIGSGAYHRDSEVHILAIPNANYHFLHWLVNGNEGTVDSADHRFVLADDITFQAVFAIDTHSVTLAADPTMGSVPTAPQPPSALRASTTTTSPIGTTAMPTIPVASR